MNLFWRLIERGPIKFIKTRKRRPFVTTNDLVDGKLSPTYMEDRKRRKKGEID